MKKFEIFILIVIVFSLSLTSVSAFDWSSDTYSYWDFEEGSGTTINDSLGKNNFTVNGLTPTNWTDGIMGSGYILQGLSESQQLFNANGNETFSINIWINTTNPGVPQNILANKDAGAPDSEGEFTFQIATGGQFTYILYHGVGTLDLDSNALHNQNNIGFQMYTITFNDSTASFYANGTLIDNESLGGAVGFPDIQMNLSGNTGDAGEQSRYFTYDEIGVWTRTLTPLEIVELYHLGAGLEYGAVGDGVVTLTSPDDSHSVLEGAAVNFNCSGDVGILNVTNVSLWIDGVINTTQAGAGTNFTELYTTLTFDEGSYDWTCKVGKSDNSSITTANRSIAVSSFIFGLCNSTSTVQYINFTFKDEGNITDDINATIDSSTWNYWIQASAYPNKSLSFSNSTENPDYPFCLVPSDQTLHHSTVLQYSFTGYPQRRWTYSTDLTNTTLNQVLYLLKSSDGIYSVYQVQTSTGGSISGVDVTAERKIGGTWSIVETGETDAAGAVTFWLNPDYDHRLTFTKTSYTSVQVTIRPSSSTYTVIMTTGGSDATYNSSLEGLKWSVSPPLGILQQNANYTFQFNITASLSNIVSCKMELLDNASNIVSTTTAGCGSTGGNLTVTFNVSTYRNIRGRYSVDVGDGLIILDADMMWAIAPALDIPERGTIYSFFKHIRNIRQFGDDPGRREFSRIILFFLILFMVLGFLCYTTGWDFATTGGSLLFVVPIIIFASMAGFFELSYAPTGEGIVTKFMQKYTVAMISTLVGFGYLFNKLAEGRR